MFKRYFESGNANYDVKVIDLDSKKSNIEVNLYFLPKQKYCCGEVTCHFKPEWIKSREIALKSGLVLSKPLTIRFNVSVPSDAVFEIPQGDDSQTNGAFEYKECFSE